MVVEFKARRDLIVDGLNAIPGIECRRPVGAFYVFPTIAGTGLSGAELAERLLQEAGVCVLPGTAFGGSATTTSGSATPTRRPTSPRRSSGSASSSSRSWRPGV